MNYSIIFDSLNNYQGLISFIGLIFVIPIAILSDKIISYLKSKKYRTELKEILLYEVWINLNYVARLEILHRNQLKDIENLHIPQYTPRTHVLGKFFEFDILNSIDKSEKRKIIEIFEQLEDLKQEFLSSKSYLLNIQSGDEMEYKKIYSTMLSYIDPIMINMLDLWIVLVKDIGAKSSVSQIQKLSEIILKKIKEGKWIHSSYKASFFDKLEYRDIPKFDVILCWENDWKNSNKEVLEIRNLVAISGWEINN